MVAYMKGFFSWIWGKFKMIVSKKEDGTIAIPKKTLSVLVKGAGNDCWWHIGKSGDNPSMQLVAHFTVTNICKFGVLPVSAKMNRPKIQGHVMTRKHDQDIYGSYVIPKGIITEVSTDFWVTPPVKRKGEPFRANIAIVDQFGNEHWVKKVEFKYH